MVKMMKINQNAVGSITDFKAKKDFHKAFWEGKTPSLILIPRSDESYNLSEYQECFYNPSKMLDSEISRSSGIDDWPTDGIACVRPNLGTIFIPSALGQTYLIQKDSMPWPGPNLTREQLKEIQKQDYLKSELISLALKFYHLFFKGNLNNITAYLPDTQGVFDIAHLLYGDNIFYDIADPAQHRWLEKFLSEVMQIYITISRHLKEVLKEPKTQMIHAHGTTQGIYFPNAGVRQSEDTATLLSPKMIDDFVVPYIKDITNYFGGSFIHYCGKHEYLFEALIKINGVRAIDLGNPEMYDIRWLLQKFAATGTVFYGKIPSEPGQSWECYIKRLGGLVKDTKSRCILRPAIIPVEYEECKKMVDMWHELTA